MPSTKRSPVRAGAAKSKHLRALDRYLEVRWPKLTKKQRSSIRSSIERHTALAPPGASEFGFVNLKSPTKGKRRKLGPTAVSVSGVVSTAWGVKGLLAGTVLTIAGAAIPIWPFALVGAVLAIGDKAKVLKGESLHEDEALALWTMWLEKDQHDWVGKGSFVAALNKQRKIYKREAMADGEVATLVRQLEKAKFIERTDSPAGWNVKEKIEVV